MEILRLAQKYADEIGLECCGGDDVGGQVLARWEAVLGDLERDPLALDGQLDWVTKWALLRAYIDDRDGLKWNDPKLSPARPAVPRLRPDRSLYERLVRAGKVERMVTEEEVIEAMTVPPATTRAYFRGECLAPRWPDAVVAANWDSVILDVGLDPVAADSDDGTVAGNEGTRRAVVRRGGKSRRTGRPTTGVSERKLRNARA